MDAWKPFVICKHCGLGYERTARDVEWHSSPTPYLQPEMFVLYIEMRCDQKDCKFPVKLYLNSDSAMTKTDRDAKLESGSRNARCEAGHAPVEPLAVIQYTIAEQIY
jgi:hypothetical protein